MENATLTPEHQQLRTLLEQYSDASQALPDLKTGAPDGWGAAAREWLHNGVTAFWEWFKALLGSAPVTPVPIDWPVVLGSLFWICMVVLVCWLTYVLMQRHLRHRRSQDTRGEFRTHIASEAEQWGELLRAAVAAERWDLASRLRWRLFLSRMHCQLHMTPQEFFRAPAYRQSWDQLHGTPVSEQYRVMFSATNGSPQWFTDYHSRLADLEGEPRSA